MKALPALRSDLLIQRQSFSGGTTIIVKDPVKNTYYSFAEEEHFVLELLDGKKTAADIASLFNERFHDELTAEDIVEFIASIQSKDLLERSLREKNVFLYEQLKEQRKSRIRHAKGSVFYFRIPMIDPDRFLDRVLPYIRWGWSPFFVRLSIVFMLSSIAVLLMNRKAVAAGLAGTFDIFSQDPASLALLWFTVMVIIAIHELGHGFTCKRFGGECHEIGFLFMFFTPCMYCNVNDAWMFTNRRHRLYVNFAGCYIEFLIGSAAVYVWALTQPGVLLHEIAFKVVVVCFFSAVFMNFNPLMKYDGYFALSDYLETPNLRTRSREYIGHILQTAVFRLKRERESLTRRERRILGTYGVLSTAYLVNVLGGLLLLTGGFLIRTFHWAGLLLTGLFVYKLFGMYIRKAIGFMRLVMTEHAKIVRHPAAVFSAGGLFLALAVASAVFPVRWHVKVSSTLHPVRETVLRALHDGYVTTLDAPGMTFKKDDIVLVMKNAELDLQIHQMRLNRRENAVKRQAALANSDAAAKARLDESARKIEDSLADLIRRQRNLKVIAPFDGTLTQSLEPLENTIVRKGDVIGRLMATDAYRATLEIPENDIEGIRPGGRAKLLLNSRPDLPFAGSIAAIAPVHTTRGQERFYSVTVDFPNKKQLLRAGLNGTVLIESRRETILRRLLRWTHKTVRMDLQI